ncbi:MAG: hypothetical protein EON90_09895 [Brevundimonas sp.]|nr:MAG: hypothetical protein EON90_09895 [Brevundimonas sp.]
MTTTERTPALGGDEPQANATKPEGEAVAWQRYSPQSGWAFTDPEDLEHYRAKGQPIRALGVLPAHPAPQPVEGIREKVARIIDPIAFDWRDNFLLQAAEWEARDPKHHSETTRRFMADGKRDKAADCVRPAFAKADAILALQSRTGGLSNGG